MFSALGTVLTATAVTLIVVLCPMESPEQFNFKVILENEDLWELYVCNGSLEFEKSS